MFIRNTKNDIIFSRMAKGGRRLNKLNQMGGNKMNNIMNKKLKKRKGFTLIELIVVLAILGILAAIAVPNFTAIQEDAKLKADTATANGILKAARLQHFADGVADDAVIPTLKSTYFDLTDAKVQSSSNDSYYLTSYEEGTTTKVKKYAIIWNKGTALTVTDATIADGKVTKAATVAGTLKANESYIVEEKGNTIINIEADINTTPAAAVIKSTDPKKDYTIIQVIKPSK